MQYHWLPEHGAKQFDFDQTMMTAGLDPDYSKRQMYEKLHKGGEYKWKMMVQVSDVASRDWFPGRDTRSGVCKVVFSEGSAYDSTFGVAIAFLAVAFVPVLAAFLPDVADGPDCMMLIS